VKCLAFLEVCLAFLCFGNLATLRARLFEISHLGAVLLRGNLSVGFVYKDDINSSSASSYLRGYDKQKRVTPSLGAWLELVLDLKTAQVRWYSSVQRHKQRSLLRRC